MPYLLRVTTAEAATHIGQQEGTGYKKTYSEQRATLDHDKGEEGSHLGVP